MIMSNGTYKFVLISKDSLNNKTQTFYIVNNVLEHNETYETYGLNITINDNLMTIENYDFEDTIVYDMDENKYFHFKGCLSDFKRLNNNIIYSCNHETITLYHLANEQFENIDVSKYGMIINCANLKDKIFMSMCYENGTDHYSTCLVIYDVTKKIFQVDYSKLEHTVFMKYNNILVLYNMYHDTFEEIIDSNNYEILFLTLDVKSEKFDTFFKFK